MTSYSQVVEGGGRENVNSEGMKWGGGGRLKKESSLDLTFIGQMKSSSCFLTSAYDGNVWSALCPAAFTFPNVIKVPIGAV